MNFKYLLIPIAALILVSCGSPEAQYTKLVETTYNYNVSPVKVISNDTLIGSFTVTKDKEQNSASIIDDDSDYKLLLTFGDVNTISQTYEGKTSSNDESTGYEVSFSYSGDTLIVSDLPKKVSDPTILKFGSVYKFFN